MKDLEIRKYERLARSSDFGAAHSSTFPAASLGGQKFTALAAEVETLAAHATAQAGGKGAAQASTHSKRAARDDVRRKMVAIRETALAMDEEIPGVSANFRIPRANGDQALINSARAFVVSATPLKAQFLLREIPATFLEDLTAAINAFEAAVNEKNAHTEKRITATAAIRAALERGAKLLRELDPIARNKFRNDPATLAAWESATHVARPPKRTQAIAPPAPPTQ